MKRLLAGFALALAALGAHAQMNGGVMESQKQGVAAIKSGTIDGTAIGGTTPAAGAFTTLSASGLTTSSAGLRLGGPLTLGVTNTASASFESPVTRYYIGDGTGYSFAFSKRAGSATTDMVTITDRARLAFSSTFQQPTISACGTSPAIVGSDNAMLVTVGTGGVATVCSMAFSGGAAWAVAPVCVAQNNTDRVSYSITTSTTGVSVTATAAFTAGSKFHVICMGQF